MLERFGADGAGGGGVLVGGELEVPGGGVVEVGVAEFADVAGEAGGFGFELGVEEVVAGEGSRPTRLSCMAAVSGTPIWRAMPQRRKKLAVAAGGRRGRGRR